MERYFKILVIIISSLFLSSCSEEPKEAVKNDENTNRDIILISSFDSRDQEWNRIEISIEQQEKIAKEIKQLKKFSPLYVNGEYQGLDSAYDDGSFMIRVSNNPSSTLYIIEDAPYRKDHLYWHNLESEDKEVEGIYKTEYNLKEKLNQILELE